MNVRKRLESGNYRYGTSSQFNTTGLSEVVCYFEDIGADSEYISELEVEVEVNGTKVWKSMSQAFADKDILINNLNTEFDVPHSESEFKQGFNWY